MLIDGVTVRGASDAGIYVGQSQDIVVRNCLAERNVAGIEIENSWRADVHDNISRHNTGGILVFDLPNLPQQGGRDIRVFANTVADNDTDNFAPKGNTVAMVPRGLGIMVMANRNVDREGTTVQFDYSVPNRNQCKGCHGLNGELVPLGVKARNLNRALPARVEREQGGAINQLTDWRERGILLGLPEINEVERAADWRDASAPLENRARTWLDVNCAHCHRVGGAASNSGLFLDAGQDDPVALGIAKRPAAAGRGAGDRNFDIVAGEPDRSILLYRIESTEPGVMMPELGRHIGDPDGAALIREWISSLR